MPKQNLTQYAVLGLLNAEPRTGYDIKQFVESAMGHFWNESYRWIYTTLEQLESDGLAASRADDRGERERNIYRITKKGERSLQGWLIEPARSLKVRDELLLKVLLGSPRTTTRHIREHHERMLQRHQELADLERGIDGLELGALKTEQAALTLDLARRITAAHLRWCEEALKKTPAARTRAASKRRRTRS